MFLYVFAFLFSLPFYNKLNILLFRMQTSNLIIKGILVNKKHNKRDILIQINQLLMRLLRSHMLFFFQHKRSLSIVNWVEKYLS